MVIPNKTMPGFSDRKFSSAFNTNSYPANITTVIFFRKSSCIIFIFFSSENSGLSNFSPLLHYTPPPPPVFPRVLHSMFFLDLIFVCVQVWTPFCRVPGGCSEWETVGGGALWLPPSGHWLRSLSLQLHVLWLVCGGTQQTPYTGKRDKTPPPLIPQLFFSDPH